MPEMANRDDARAPKELPAPIRRARRGEPARDSFSVELETVTPILGGAVEPRTIDDIDVIRAPTIRGHLRFWWRALYGTQKTPRELFEAESAFWGSAADDNRGRSDVEIVVEPKRPPPRPDESEIHYQTPGAYALWPGMGSKVKGKEQEPAARYQPPVRFSLVVSAPDRSMSDVRAAFRAWLLFGGYGSRTRRGLGSLRLVDARAQTQWLPDIEDPYDIEPSELQPEFKGELQRLFHPGVFDIRQPERQLPSLGGATLLLGGFHRADRARNAWLEALSWLSAFRQGRDIARERGEPRKPGRSRWPEADKLRHLNEKFGHPPRYTDPTPAWPRAVFGLPIVGRFVGENEPSDFELRWQIDEAERKPGEERIKDRLASPLILKPLQTVQGFYPCALWLNRAFPPGTVVVKDMPDSSAAFGFLGTANDAQVANRLKAPLSRHTNVQEAFFDWLKRKDDVVQVAP